MNKRIEILLHVAVWAVLFLTPLNFLNRENGFHLSQYLMTCMSPILVMIVFYSNYLWLTPHYFVTGKHRYYWLCNIIMVVALGIFLHYWISLTHDLFDQMPPPRHHEHTTVDMLVFILRDIFNLSIAAGIATAIVLALRWQKAEQARRDAESARIDAELKTLRNQINPHFLLNTLNNIYALTAFDTAKAQEAIQQLSKMLRHILYDCQQATVPLQDEMEFLENYIQLMHIRLPESVKVSSDFSIFNSHLQVAPMIFISLVENAFKHGISPTKPSFIDIKIEADSDHITCDIKNSNHPKAATDHSGHGIGLKQVQRRLDLAYPNHYTWERGLSADGETYHSRIVLNCR